MDEKTDLVPIATFGTLSEAEVARSLLDAEGIEGVLQDEPLASLMPPVAFANGGLTVKVAAEDADRAREILSAPDDADAAADPDAEALAEPEASGDGAGI